jgi:hypothetical protein
VSVDILVSDTPLREQAKLLQGYASAYKRIYRCCYSNYLRFFIDTTLFNLHSIDLQHFRMEATQHVPRSDHRKQRPSARLGFPSTDPNLHQSVESAAHPADQITVRDLAVNPVPHLDSNLLGGWMKSCRSAQRQRTILAGPLQRVD